MSALNLPRALPFHKFFGLRKDDVHQVLVLLVEVASGVLGEGCAEFGIQGLQSSGIAELVESGLLGWDADDPLEGYVLVDGCSGH